MGEVSFQPKCPERRNIRVRPALTTRSKSEIREQRTRRLDSCD